MSDAPERIWACQSGPMVGLFVSSWSGTPMVRTWPEYLRLDLHTAALAERDARIAALGACLKECADDLASAVNYEYPLCLRDDYPEIYERQYARDMGPVVRARALLDGGKA